MVGQECDKRDIIIKRKDATLQRVSETHRLYDALQYPLIYWNGQDGYHFNLYEQNSSKKVRIFTFYTTKTTINRTIQ